MPCTERDRVFRRKTAGTAPDELIVGAQAAGRFDHRSARGLRNEGVVGPQRAAEKPRAVEHNFAAIEQHDPAGAGRRSEGVLHGVEIALVVFVVSGEVEHRAGKGPPRPLDAGGAVVDVAGENHQVGLDVRRGERLALEVQIRKNPRAGR